MTDDLRERVAEAAEQVGVAVGDADLRAITDAALAEVADWLGGDEVRTVVRDRMLPYLSYYDDDFPTEAAADILDALVALVRGEGS